jgi:ribosomal protein S18 acetylase RimI-like enzyme
VKIKSIALDDIDQIAGLWRQLEDMHVVYDAELGKERRYRDWAERRAELILLSSHMYLLQVLQDDEVHGYCISTLTADGLGDVESIFVAEAKRGNGWGLRLLRNSLVWFDEAKAREVQLLVHPMKLRAIEVYRRLGFTEDDCQTPRSGCRSNDAIASCIAFRLSTLAA